MAYTNDREFWLTTMLQIADPVLHSLANQQLKQQMPVEAIMEDRGEYTYLEAFARLICGMAPWIENGPDEGEEGALRKNYGDLIRQGMKEATDPQSPDYMNFSHGLQPIVDTAFLAHAIVRAPNELMHKLEPNVRNNVINALKQTRTRKPIFNNWLLFAAMIETALYLFDEDYDQMRIDFALKQHEQWYLGDGLYGDGPAFHADYYNSYVIQPMIVDIIDTVAELSPDWKMLQSKIHERAIRYAVIQERNISPEGTFPIVGRSIAYRFGAFQHLAQMALQHRLDASLKPAQVRCALTAVIRRMIEIPGTFDDNGWLRIGLCGHQPELGEPYISTGSLYLCAAVFLPLGLPADDTFWQGEEEWTTKKAWSGKNISIDSALI
ncbi:DUF2264 domain-containing protein [Gracilibacillus oryzae]|uniref:DUF2264 domain-containing protein n=1 Tax=Gracilibacillus oryzae TaxID=1672701 RepID=A0A7C8GTE9_9BACI|nr:DUF2264 domain-containing protein [Gracilibacillus oryzae]KAB8136779.1 DUF2264 domain-containing protein [Gracilibacillus oryzae]